MNNTLKVSSPFVCNTCGAKSTRVKSFKVSAGDANAAKAEVSVKLSAWVAGLQGKNCRVCQSIIDSVNQ